MHIVPFTPPSIADPKRPFSSPNIFPRTTQRSDEAKLPRKGAEGLHCLDRRFDVSTQAMAVLGLCCGWRVVILRIDWRARKVHLPGAVQEVRTLPLSFPTVSSVLRPKEVRRAMENEKAVFQLLRSPCRLLPSILTRSSRRRHVSGPPKITIPFRLWGGHPFQTPGALQGKSREILEDVTAS